MGNDDDVSLQCVDHPAGILDILIEPNAAGMPWRNALPSSSGHGIGVKSRGSKALDPIRELLRIPSRAVHK